MSGCLTENSTTRINSVANVPAAIAAASPTHDDKLKIIAYGDSLTAGFGIDDPKKFYPSLLQASLDREGFDYEVLNFGVPGDTSQSGLNRLGLALRNENISVFILELGANDIMKKTPAAQIRTNLAEIIDRVTSGGAKIVLCGFAAPASYGDGYVSEIREMYESLAAEYELPVIVNFMQDVQENPERIQNDKIHPNEKGAAIIEQNVRFVVKTLLTKKDAKGKK